MVFSKASIKYRYGSGKATSSTTIGASQIRGKSERSGIAFLKDRHKAIINFEIIIEKIE